jgi:hypothetical protein
MEYGSVVEVRREPWRLVVRTCVSLAVGAMIPWWLLISWIFATLRCDENCTAGEADSWQYPGQLVLAGSGSVLAVCALVLGFTSHQRGYRYVVVAAVTCALVWLSWIHQDF